MINANTTTKLVCILIISGILASGCASSTVLQTNPSDASVYIKGEKMGITPYTYKDRKIAGASTLITFTKEGYENYSTTLRKVEKWNICALISGLFFIYPLFWVMGYDQQHTYDMFEAVETVAVEPEIVKEETENLALTVAIDESDLVRTNTTVKNQRVESLLEQGRIDRAVEYAEKQTGEQQDACFYTLGDYYLINKNIPAAEEYFSKSGKTKEAYVKISEFYLRGVMVDSVYIIDEQKARTYLMKVYDNENLIDKHLAVDFEKFALEQIKRLKLLKGMQDMKISAIGNRTGQIDINIEYAIARVVTEIYLKEAVESYDILEYFDKAEELKNKLKILIDEFPLDEETEDRVKSKISYSN